MEIKLDGLIIKIREDKNQHFSAKPSPMDFDVDLPDLTCPDLFLISVERVTYLLSIGLDLSSN